ncbi:hypothetical protein ES703_71430 [subsurface metagenome]
MEYLSKKEFNLRFLRELQCYPPKVARDLLRECRNDIRFGGWWYAQRRWGKFIGLDKKEDACPVCGSTDWWYRPASGLGGPGARLCGRCHPEPGTKVERSPVDLSYFTIEEGERMLAVWRQEGKSAIPLSQGVRCLDLEKFLAWPTNSEHVKVVKDWANKH